MTINSVAQFTNNALDLKILGQQPTRKGYGEGLLEVGEKDPRVVALCADPTESTQTHLFAKKFPERFIEKRIGYMKYLTNKVVRSKVKVLTPLPSRLAGTAV